MTTYQETIENYDDTGLVSTEIVEFELTGEDEQRYLSPDRVRQAYQTLRQWSQDAANVDSNWDSMTTGQKDAAMRETIQRLGVMFDRLADLLLLEGRT